MLVTGADLQSGRHTNFEYSKATCCFSDEPAGRMQLDHSKATEQLRGCSGMLSEGHHTCWGLSCWSHVPVGGCIVASLQDRRNKASMSAQISARCWHSTFLGGVWVPCAGRLLTADTYRRCTESLTLSETCATAQLRQPICVQQGTPCMAYMLLCVAAVSTARLVCDAYHDALHGWLHLVGMVPSLLTCAGTLSTL